MSDEPLDSRIKDLQEKAESAGVTLKPETISDLQQKLNNEKRQVAEPRAQPGRSTIEDSEPFKDLQKRVGQEKQIEPQGVQPSAVGERAMTERTETGPEKKDKEIYLAKPASAEKESGESSPEKGREEKRYAAERRLRDLNPPWMDGGERKG